MKKQIIVLSLLSAIGFLLFAIDNVSWQRNLLYEVAGCAASIDNFLFAATKGGMLYAFNPTGQVVWQKDIRQGIISSVVINEDQIFLLTVDGTLFGFNFAGQQTLHKEFNELSFRTSPLFVGGKIFLFAANGELIIYDLKSDTVVNNKKFSAEFFSPAVFDRKSNLIFIADKNGALLGLDLEGELKWKTLTRGVIFSSPAIGKDSVYLSSMDHFFYAIDLNGKKSWEFQTERWNISSPVIDDKQNIYFGSYDQHFYAVNRNGKLLWRKRLASSINSTAVITADEQIVIGDSAGYVYQLDFSGTTIFAHKTADFIRTPLTFFAKSKAIVAFSINGTIFCYKHQSPISSNALWPKYQYDLKNSATR